MTISRSLHDLTNEDLVKAVQRPMKDMDAGDCLIELRNRYLPLIKSLIAKYYARGMDYEDWLQEAICVMIKSIRVYDPQRRRQFGGLYKRCLKNRFNDLIRKQNAKKRIPNTCITSYSANQKYYDDVLGDVKAIHPENSMITTEFLKKVIQSCSYFERTVALSVILRHQSSTVIAKDNHCSESKVKNAFERCKLKFKNLREHRPD